MQILMLSSSRSGNEAYLNTARDMIFPFLSSVSEALFIPYAGVTVDWDEYTQMVQDALPEIKIQGLHQQLEPGRAIQQAKAIIVGGGNTFNLLHQLYLNHLMDPIVQAVQTGTPYIGWSAGSNICGNSIRTTNDMPIIQPPSFNALNLVPFQINPHYSDYQPPGHNGETRAQRIAEFCQLCPTLPVIGIREGSALLRVDNTLSLLGNQDGVVFHGADTRVINAQQDLSMYLQC